MASHLKLPQAHAASLLKETIGALVFWLNQQELDVQMQQYIHREPDFTPYASVLKSDYRTFAVNGHTLGASLFLLPYERYKKELALYPTEGFKNACETFGLDRYSQKWKLREDYGDTDIATWPAATTHWTTDWFANSVRNSFAHGQTYIVRRRPNETRVELRNSRDSVDSTFHIEMLRRISGP